MKKYYGTFGTGHSLHGNYQPILADTLLQAEEIMFETYGRKWASVYTEEQFADCREVGIFSDLKPLPII